MQTGTGWVVGNVEKVLVAFVPHSAAIYRDIEFEGSTKVVLAITKQLSVSTAESIPLLIFIYFALAFNKLVLAYSMLFFKLLEYRIYKRILAIIYFCMSY